MKDYFDVCIQIRDLIGDLTDMQREVIAETEIASQKAAEIIATEQRRILAKANFKRDKNNHVYKGTNGSLISITKKITRRGRIRVHIGFDAETLREYPELLLVEFGRPGKSPKHSKITDSLGRKKGDFPQVATVMPIRVGLRLARESALAAYAEDMFEFATDL